MSKKIQYKIYINIYIIIFIILWGRWGNGDGGRSPHPHPHFNLGMIFIPIPPHFPIFPQKISPKWGWGSGEMGIRGKMCNPSQNGLESNTMVLNKPPRFGAMSSKFNYRKIMKTTLVSIYINYLHPGM